MSKVKILIKPDVQTQDILFSLNQSIIDPFVSRCNYENIEFK